MGELKPVHPPPRRRVIARWDLDKTYLRTDFDTLGELLRTAFETPEQKRAVPGAAALLRELGTSGARVHILSGSPRQMRRQIEAKLSLDGVRWDELTLKPNLGNLLRLRLSALRDQLGYKLPALLDARGRDQTVGEAGLRPVEVLVGDDAESDAFIYSLYADVCAGQIDDATLGKILRAGAVYRDQLVGTLSAARRVRRGQTVTRILIHLDRQTPPSRFASFGPRLVPFYNYLQAAFVLAEDALLTPEALTRIAALFALRFGFDADALARSYRDLLRRGHVRGLLVGPLRDALRDAPSAELDAARPQLSRMVELLGAYEAEPVSQAPQSRTRPDYVQLASRHRGGNARQRHLT